ncbi:EAL domain-containing protein [Nocardioides sp. BP30]|uniref:EAL domain-containing protein n=1 Tax=Nocardioides sp. BP30 TaxID=3036374 RepID=UPI0024682760|nr:EAL domain-containing protein [Nocardioides sp. BP30]WGL50983.1 EAL domain-containing protein [Nocardioides sp. BP30]
MHAGIDTLMLTADGRLAATVAAAASADGTSLLVRRTQTPAGVLAALNHGQGPDLLLVDVTVCSGAELRQLLHSSAQRDTAVVALVPAGEEQRGLDAIQLGAEDYLEGDDATVLRALCKVARASVARHRSNPARYLRTILDNSPDVVITVDQDLVVRQANATAERFFQVEADDMLGRSVDELAPPEERDAQRAALLRALSGVPAAINETERRLPDGTVAHISLTCLPVTGDDGAVIGACTIVHDISETVAARHRLERTLKRQEVAEEAAHVGAFEVDLATMQIAISRELARLHYRDPDDLVLSIDDLLRGVHRDDRELLLALQDVRGPATIDYRFRGPDGTDPRLLEISGRWLPGDGPDHAGYFVGIERDVTEQRAQEEQMRFLAHHDPLTGALNRRAFEALLAQRVGQHCDEQQASALLMIDLDGFKHHNDTYGHAVGDAILVRIAGAVSNRLPAQAALGRIGGDEFVVFLPEAGSEHAAQIADLLLAVVADAARTASPDPVHPVTASIGIAGFAGAAEPALVLRRADEAMYAAKSNGGRQWAHWSEQPIDLVDPVIDLTTAAGNRLERLAALAVSQTSARRELLRDLTLDTATGLPGRHHFLGLVEHRLTGSADLQAAYAVRLGGIDLLDDSTERTARDALVGAVAARLAQAHGPGALVGLLDDAELGLLLPAGTLEHRERLARRLLSCLEEPFAVAGGEFALLPAIGIATGGRDGDAYTLFRDASIAAAAPRTETPDGFRHYERSLRTRATARLAEHAALRRAITNREFGLVFQPALELATGVFNRAESLVRWYRPGGEVVGPDRFIPLAEATGLIVPLGDLVLDLAIDQALAWRAALPHVRIPVNLSAVQLGMPGFAAGVMTRVADAGLTSWPITFEVTESALMENLEASQEALQQLRDAEFRVVIDDFGTGHSSLARLDQLPVGGIKVDKLLVKRLAGDPTARAVLRAIVDVGKAYSMLVTAEGIEDAETLRIVREIGVDYAQGYHLSRPRPAGELVELLRRGWPH